MGRGSSPSTPAGCARSSTPPPSSPRSSSGLYSASSWATWLYAIHATPFGKTDPVLGRDIAFYVFQLPLLELVHGIALTTVILTIVGVAGSHVAAGNLALDPLRGVIASPAAKRHLSLLAAVLLVVLAFGAWLRIPHLLTEQSGVVFGASYVDVHARMPAYRLLAVAALVGAALAVYQAFAAAPPAHRLGRRALCRRRASAAASYAGVIQRFVVGAQRAGARDALHREQHHARRARRSGSIGVEERALSGDATLSRADLERNAATIENVPLWNDQPLLDTFGQMQEIRTYYDFVSVDNDRYIINGKYRQIMLSARELNSRSLPSRTWINEQLTFTHGYGLTLGPVNEVTPEGLPVLFIRDLPLDLDRRLEGHAAGHLLRRAARDRRLRQHQDRRVRLSARRRQRLCDLQGQRRRAARRALPPADVRDPVPLDRHVLLADADAGEPRDDAPAHQRARQHRSRRS